MLDIRKRVLRNYTGNQLKHYQTHYIILILHQILVNALFLQPQKHVTAASMNVIKQR